ncbi:hypothetical protein T492DRAFT_901100 [Pavlovales sp. CCMP2436]|nr:hypothetical protein T492DRAFT_901100 [Pavlovales sp. CCMP2436]
MDALMPRAEAGDFARSPAAATRPPFASRLGNQLATPPPRSPLGGHGSASKLWSPPAMRSALPSPASQQQPDFPAPASRATLEQRPQPPRHAAPGTLVARRIF